MPTNEYNVPAPVERLPRGRISLWVCTLFVAIVGAVPPSAAATPQDTTRQQPLIRGVLLDDLSRVPVSAALVRLVRGEAVLASTVSDAQGRFSMQAPAAGTYRLRLERIGYRALESADLTVSAGATTSVELFVAPGPILLDSILVPGRKQERRVGRTEQLIHGRLLDDDTREPIVSGTVSLVRIDSAHSLFNHKVQEKVVARTISNRDGLFRLITPLPGKYTLRAERIGYQTAESSQLLMMIGDTVRLDFHLSTQAVLLDPIVVLASARPWRDRYELVGMEDFFKRMRQWGGGGHSEFVTREALDTYLERGFTVSKVIGDVMIRPAPSLKAMTIRGIRPMEQGCSGTITYLDGGWFGDTLFLESLSLKVLEAIEVHRAPFLPAELITTFNPGATGGSAGASRFPCDIVVLWSRRQPKR